MSVVTTVNNNNNNNNNNNKADIAVKFSHMIGTSNSRKVVLFYVMVQFFISRCLAAKH